MFGTVLITCPPDRAEEIARILVEEKLAACVNVLPKVTSFYRWEGKTNKDEEALLTVKKRLDILEIVKRRLRELHPYEVPEMIALPIVMGLREYLVWLDRETRKA